MSPVIATSTAATIIDSWGYLVVVALIILGLVGTALRILRNQNS